MSRAPILPGATIGFLGGGQLGRMSAMAARAMGYDVHVLDPDPACPARAVASRTITAPFTDVAAAEALARDCAVVTLDIEQVATPAIAACEAIVPVRPGAAALHIVQDRVRQKEWLASLGFPLGPFGVARRRDELDHELARLMPAIVKTAQGGYDGRGQVRVRDAADVAAALPLVDGVPVVIEQWLALAGELSVMVARDPAGATRTYPVAFNHHDHGVLTWSMTPAPVAPAIAQRATEVAVAICEALGLVGLLAVEFFVTADGEVLVNELAPRPHNTFHTTERSAPTSQFEQQVRAVCGLPLGDTTLVTPGAIVNLLGDIWPADGRPPAWERALELPGVRLHLYGKAEARPGRKMGHLSAIGPSAEAARDTVLAAYARLLDPPR